ncbi:MAG TPA: DUF1223 domain-containing protein [Acidobacteriaceae bacterium]|nr:DUF1223 domain-containing protein [Acidobacteriaceae bacterium]
MIRSNWAWLAAVAALLALAGAGASGSAATPPDSGRTPILMELFTSEGCSSCPPVDNWVERLDAAQPIAGAQLIVLSEHVDYWDHDGWKDPFSSPAITDRQRGYMNALSLKDVYTPQVIVDGDVEVHPDNGQQADAALHQAAAAAMIAVKIDGAALATGVLTGKIEADGTSQKHGGDVYVAVAMDKTQTDVLAGENDGRKLTNIAVVRELVKVGKLDKGKSFDQPFRIKLWPDADPANLRVVAFVQESGPGKVLGAAMTKEIGKGQ